MTSYTVIIVVITSLISFIAFNNIKLMDTLIFWPPAVSMRHQYWRFITCGLIHADFMHLLFNMFTLYFFGRGLENLYMGELGLQHYYFLILYFLALIFSNIPTYLKRKDDYNYRSLGASGAVSAVMFAVILIRPWEKLYLYASIPMPSLLFAVLFIGYSVYMSKRGGDNVNHDAHLWGAVFGIVFTVAVDHDSLGNFINALRHPQF
ncbi:MAG TPA: rhomboid family intramembrane serine protease [Puia sp.]|uniref:rhomboid family intramembrane serine protease n=1 Tax=Puia sp. TaxID=2045100 RepID=UPI002B78E448|nr:rhomboid family intramembrane serine protease [Puia sp.]HVU94567.1 rhomboid family intramembrane serine protease [Puia sp.]